MVRDEIVEQKNSLDRAWVELEALQAEMLEQKAEIQILKTDINNLKRNVESEKQKRLHLDFCSRKKNLRLIGIKENGDDECMKENGDEDCKKLVRKILDEMGVLHYGLDFHEVHRVPQVVPSQKDKQDTPRQIIMRFTSSKDLVEIVKSLFNQIKREFSDTCNLWFHANKKCRPIDMTDNLYQDFSTSDQPWHCDICSNKTSIQMNNEGLIPDHSDELDEDIYAELKQNLKIKGLKVAHLNINGFFHKL